MADEGAVFHVGLELRIHGSEFVSPDRWNWGELLDIDGDDARLRSIEPRNQAAHDLMKEDR